MFNKAKQQINITLRITKKLRDVSCKCPINFASEYYKTLINTNMMKCLTPPSTFLIALDLEGKELKPKIVISKIRKTK